jgi:lysozyme family protein
MRRLGLDLDGDGDVDRDDVRRITAAQATDIFIEHYFERPRIGDLPEVLQPSVFDMYVNAGVQRGRILQRLLRRMGHDIAVDGIIGPHTIRAAHVAAGRARPPRRRLRHRAAQATTTASPTAARPAGNTPAPRWREGRLDQAGGGPSSRRAIT